jgi:hypothetical protein
MKRRRTKMDSFVQHVLLSEYNDVKIRIGTFDEHARCPDIDALVAEGARQLVVTNSIFETLNYRHTIRQTEVAL